MSEISPLFGGNRTQSGQKISSAIARQTKREVEHVAAGTERAAVVEQAHAFLASQQMSNVSTLVMQAQAHLAANPAGAELYEDIVRAYAHGALVRGSRLQL